MMIWLGNVNAWMLVTYVHISKHEARQGLARW